LFLRTGRFGPYLTWGDQKQSLPHLKHGNGNGNGNHYQNVDDIPLSYDEAVQCINHNATNAITASSQTQTSILREINANASVRTGQYGAYIYYKTPKMKTPAFVSLRGFKEDWKTCDLQLLDAWSTTNPVKKKR